jgi:hypothetical protein
MHAIQNRNLKLVKLLLKNKDKGFVLNNVETHGKEGLIVSILHDSLSMVSLLLENSE